MPLVSETYALLESEDEFAKPDRHYFVETTPKAAEVNECPLLSEDEFFQIECRERRFNVAIGDPRARQVIANRCIERGGKPLSIRSAQAVVYKHNEIGEGAVLCAFTTITSNAKIGRFFHANLYSYVAHDCLIGDFVTFAPNVHCNGHVHIGNGAYIGAGALIRNGSAGAPLIVGEGAVIGMGAVVTKNVDPFTTVVGNPARPLTAARASR